MRVWQLKVRALRDTIYKTYLGLRIPSSEVICCVCLIKFIHFIFDVLDHLLESFLQINDISQIEILLNK